MKSYMSALVVLCALAAIAICGCGGGGGVGPALVRGQAARSLSASHYVAGTPLQFSVTVYPLTTTEYFAVEDVPPAGWVVANISDSGVFDGVTGKVKWGPFSDNVERILTYEATPPQGATGAKALSGVMSMDGTSVATGGNSSISN